MTATAKRLKKIETALPLCAECRFTREQEELFSSALRAQGVEPIQPTATNTRRERCEQCGQLWLVVIGFDDDWLIAEDAALAAITKRNDEANQPTSREEWERYFAYNEAIENKRRDYYGATVYDQAWAATRWPQLWDLMRERAASAPTNAEREIMGKR